MIPLISEEATGGREVLLTGANVAGGTADHLLALAWARLAGSVAPLESVSPDRVLVIRPVCVHGGRD